MLNTTYTATYGSPAVNLTYGSKVQLDGLAVEFSAPSPSGDLNGRPTLSISHARTKQGIIRTLVSLRTPQFTGSGPTLTTKGFFTKLDLVLNRTADLPIEAAKVEIEKLISLLSEATMIDAISQMEV